jgi:general secretion pathway protein C
MLLNTSDTPAARWLVRVGTFAVWALALASVVYWGLKATSAPDGPVAAVASDVRPAPDPVAVSRLLGARAAQAATPVAPNVAGRFSLAGVLADLRLGGAALIAVDGKPAKPYRVGSVVEDNLVLQSVAPRRAVLGTSIGGPAAFTLELPSLKK